MMRYYIIFAMFLAPFTVNSATDASPYNHDFTKESGNSMFRKGMESFRNEQYAAALRLFEQAKLTGMHSTRLNYNLGVTHYKLAQYKAAIPFFMECNKDKDLASMAFINLGLINLKLNNNDSARDFFLLAHKNALTSKQRNLSERYLHILNIPYQEKQEYFSKTNANIKIVYGYNDNVINNINDTIEPMPSTENKQDDYFSTSFINFSTDIINNITLTGSSYYLNYSSLDEYDYRFNSISITPKLIFSKYWISSTIQSKKSSLDKDNHMTFDSVTFRYHYNINKTWNTAFKLHTSKDSNRNNKFRYFNGTQRALEFSNIFRYKIANIFFLFGRENNNRNNNAMRSYSPQIDYIKLGAHVNKRQHIFNASLYYRDAYYKKHLLVEQRFDYYTQFSFTYNLVINPTFQLHFSTSAVKNRSEFEDLNYSSHLYSLGLNVYF